MVNKSLVLSDEEEALFNAKLRGRTIREAVLDSMNIPYEKRQVGRPTLDQITKKLDSMREEYRLFEQEKVAEGLKVKGDADGLSTFEVAQRKRMEKR